MCHFEEYCPGLMFVLIGEYYYIYVGRGRGVFIKVFCNYSAIKNGTTEESRDSGTQRTPGCNSLGFGTRRGLNTIVLALFL
jgi:hypothetical protein